ncbi:hypothetical protein D3C85_1052540 [compost metagenome]
MQAGGRVQDLVDVTQYIGQGLPEGVLDHRKTPFGLIHRAWPAAANLLGVPGLGDQPQQALAHPFALGIAEVAMVLGGQLRGNGVVFLDQGAARHFGGVGGQHQFDVQAAQLPGQLLRAVPGGQQALQQVTEHAVFEGLGLSGAAPADAVVLLGDVGQVEELVEGAGHRQQFVIAEPVEGLVELALTLGRALAGGLGALADTLDLVEKGLAQLGADGVAEQLAEQVDILAQARVDFGHFRLSVTGFDLQIAQSAIQIQGCDEWHFRVHPQARLKIAATTPDGPGRQRAPGIQDHPPPCGKRMRCL